MNEEKDIYDDSAYASELTEHMGKAKRRLIIDNFEIVNRIRQRLFIELKVQDRSGIYGYMQRKMAYNSNKIEGSTLTERQTISMFETGTLISEDNDLVIRSKDVEEMSGHFKMFNYMLITLDEPLSHEIVKGMHRNLKEGVFEDMANGYAVGEYKKRANLVGHITTALPQEVPGKMEYLLASYNNNAEASLEDIAIFHAEFEKIHPFQDGNGRVGRMLLMRQCLKENIIPIIIEDNSKARYYKGLEAAQCNNDILELCEYFKERQQAFLDDILPLVFTYEEFEQRQNHKVEEIMKAHPAVKRRNKGMKI